MDWKLVNESEYTKYVYVSGGADAGGSPMGVDLTLPFGDDGLPAYDKIYNTLQGTDSILQYTNDTQNGGVAIRPNQYWS